MAKRIIEIKVDCCGDCPYYNHLRHCCGEGACEENSPADPFYSDCPLDWRDDDGL